MITLLRNVLPLCLRVSDVKVLTNVTLIIFVWVDFIIILVTK